MASYTTELDCVRTFLLAVHVAATTEHYPAESGKIENIISGTDQKMLVFPPELIGSDGDDFYWKRYKVEISETSEATMMIALNKIIIGIRDFNKRATITGFTYASAPTMCHVRLAKSSIVKAYRKSTKWNCDLWLDVEWSTS